MQSVVTLCFYTLHSHNQTLHLLYEFTRSIIIIAHIQWKKLLAGDSGESKRTKILATNDLSG
ncbi:hypothetical protein EOV50_07630 [Salmonella enterica subsp. enterica serovar Mokola]|nr:hypothetical protein [Salmonella enterica subsp. enterica serovar Enteritidis]ECA6748088.1 hypothetical protein [Salmonella enterica subsp. enterica serovar Mokola]ECG2647852.1 hypothetical protein [Salmonella enterica subsp. enterica serovar Chailey]EBU6658455.1 hypothetical protein [Salmonella enterica subsp. enterica serovar Enteritidis]EBV1258520.1 hypothetical protein [Salmonella enterica subsp. enterica serovar Enteritidis]